MEQLAQKLASQPEDAAARKEMETARAEQKILQEEARQTDALAETVISVPGASKPPPRHETEEGESLTGMPLRYLLDENQRGVL